MGMACDYVRQTLKSVVCEVSAYSKIAEIKTAIPRPSQEFTDEVERLPLACRAA
jgi:hypothetical protein